MARAKTSKSGWPASRTQTCAHRSCMGSAPLHVSVKHVTLHYLHCLLHRAHAMLPASGSSG